MIADRESRATLATGDLPWVSASDVGEVAFCPEAFRLRLIGSEPSKRARDRMAAGTRNHAIWTRAGRRQGRGLRLGLAAALLLLLAGVIVLLVSQ